MATSDHTLRFRQDSTESLITLKASLIAKESVFSQQAMGSKSFTRDLRFMADQINAICFVLAERGYTVHPTAPTANYGAGICDFSNVQ